MEYAIKTNMKSIIFRAKWTGRVCAVGSMTPECIKNETADAPKNDDFHSVSLLPWHNFCAFISHLHSTSLVMNIMNSNLN